MSRCLASLGLSLRRGISAHNALSFNFGFLSNPPGKVWLDWWNNAPICLSPGYTNAVVALKALRCGARGRIQGCIRRYRMSASAVSSIYRRNRGKWSYIMFNAANAWNPDFDAAHASTDQQEMPACDPSGAFIWCKVEAANLLGAISSLATCNM